MNVKGLNWLVTCTPQFEEMATFFRDVLGLAVKSEGVPVTDTRFTRYVQFKLPNGDIVEVLDAEPPVLRHFAAPVVQFQVDNLVTARQEMERKGVEFLGQTYHSEGEGWAYFRAPDGQVYLIGGPYAEPA